MKNQFCVLAMWQLCSIVMCSAGTVCTVIANNYETTLTMLMLVFTYSFLFLSNVWWWPKSDTPWWKYIIVSICCVSGDYFAIQAYNHTSLSSAMILNTTVIFWVIPLAYFIIGRKSNWIQLLSILVAFIGIVMVIVADGFSGNHWLGNVFSLINSICYAIATVLQEKLVMDDSVRLYLCRFSACSLPLAGILSGALEHKQIAEFKWCWESAGLMLLYAILLTVYNHLAPFTLQYSNATVMNISLLTSNFYSLAISIFAFGQKASFMYLVGFFCIPMAIAMYSFGTPKENVSNSNLNPELNAELISADVPHVV